MRGRGGDYRMVFGFSTMGIYAISAITTNVVSSNPSQARCPCTTLCNKVFSDLRQVVGFLWFPPPIKLTATI